MKSTIRISPSRQITVQTIRHTGGALLCNQYRDFNDQNLWLDGTVIALTPDQVGAMIVALEMACEVAA